MRDWLSPQELADLGLPGLPDSKQGWNELIDREGWLERKGKVRPRRGKGGGFEYHVDLLPPAALASYAARAIGAVEIPREDLAAAAADPQAAQLTLPALESRDARLALIAAADRFARNASLSRRTTDTAFSALYGLDKLDIAPWIKAAVGRLSPRTLARWREQTKNGSASRLGVDRGAARRGKGVLATAEGGEVRRYILALVAHQPHLSADHVRECVAAKFPAFAPPPVRTFQHVLKDLKRTEGALLAKITNPDAFKSRFRLSGVKSHPVSRLNELWQIDASPADALCVDGRHSIYACVDIFSRRLSIQVTRTPRAESVALLMRRAILAWGVPERVKTDNGSDFKAKATQRLFASLQIETEASTPFSPEQKGHIERAIGTLQRDLMPLLPGFIGHSVKDRSVIEERKAFSARLGESDAEAFCVELKAAELQRYCNEWAENRYAHRPHDGLAGATPFAAAAAYPGKVKRIDDLRALDLLLAPIAARTACASSARPACASIIRTTSSPRRCPARRCSCAWTRPTWAAPSSSSPTAKPISARRSAPSSPASIRPKRWRGRAPNRRSCSKPAPRNCAPTCARSARATWRRRCSAAPRKKPPRSSPSRAATTSTPRRRSTPPAKRCGRRRRRRCRRLTMLAP